MKKEENVFVLPPGWCPITGFTMYHLDKNQAAKNKRRKAKYHNEKKKQ